MAYPHAPAEVPLYMHFPKGYEFKDGISEDTHVLKLTKNIYGQKQAGRVWNKYLDEGLGEISFKPSKMDPALSSVILQKDTQGKPFNNDFHY